MDCCTKRKFLSIMTSSCACAAFGFLCIAVATDYWLVTEEKPKTTTDNASVTIITTHSGLWRKCTDKLRFRDFVCTYISYFSAEQDRDDLTLTEAIIVNMKRSTAFPLTSLLILLIGGILCFLGHCNAEKKILTFVSGILFVMAGLCTLVGLILYIGSITEEAGNKDKASMDQKKFEYSYGSSFILAVGSFALTELSGVFSVYLYISRQKQIQRNKTKQPLKTESNERPNYLKYKRNRSRSRERSHSRERSRDTSLTRSESYFTYTPVSDTSHELCNYNFSREASGNTIMTTAETHTPRDNAVPIVDFLPRSTPV